MKIRPFYYHFKIKDKIFSIMLLLLVIFCLFGIIAFHYFSKMYEDEIYKQSAKTLQLSSAVLDKELSEIEQLSFQVSTDDFVQNSLKSIKDKPKAYEVYRTKAKLMDALVNYATQKRYISSIQIIDNHGKTYIAGFNTKIKYQSEDILPQVFSSKGANVWSGIENQNKISATRIIRGKENISLEFLGTLIITIDMEKLIRGSLKIPEDNDLVITRDDAIVYMSDLNKLEDQHIPAVKVGTGYEKMNISDKDYLIAYHDSEFSNLTYYHFLPFDTITNQSSIIKKLLFVYFLFMLFLTIFLSRRAASALSKPIEGLTVKMKQAQKGKFEQSDFGGDEYPNDEVGQLHENFQIMIHKINTLIKENYQKQLVIKETEYKALQAQINPHFLYNTLDSINWMAKLNKQPNISIMAEALGNMMRNIISKKAPLISIKDELEIVNNYITIQKYRYHDRLDFSLDRLAEVESFLIPKLSIQPIIENAIQHGLEESVDGCKIGVSTTLVDNDHLCVVVEDNGPGMDESTIESIFNGELKSKGTGIGLRNINERIQLMFGSSYGVVIKSEPGKGTKVIITLPCRME
jgi:two-component system, sensor histidine kinase YesM